MGRESNGFEGAKRPFGRERSEPSCPGLGSAERSAAEHGPNSSFFISSPASYPLLSPCSQIRISVNSNIPNLHNIPSSIHFALVAAMASRSGG